MTAGVWLKILFSIVGLIAFGALVWFAFPFIGWGSFWPFEGYWPRIFLILFATLVVFGFIGYGIWKRRKAAAELEAGIAAAEAAESDAAILDEKMKDALLTLRKTAGSSANYLYELPWYMMIGPPGSGKTTALVNSGLKFPLAKGGAPSAVAGVGGTRYCDWWFTDEAVMIDTAGRYTTQDSDEKVDRKSWLAFLEMLKSTRPRQPLNGVMVCISIEDLLTAKPAEINAHADAIRARLSELHQTLKVDFPVYALFTKMDLVAGFMEYFSHLNEAGRRVVWGATFQTNDKTLNNISDVPGELDALIERLSAELPDRLQEEPTPNARALLFGFPTQMAAVRKVVTEFLNRIFEPTRYHSNATLRGFYFTSGTQAGTPIDQLLGALSRSFGAAQVASGQLSGSGKSYFLTDLITRVIIGEAAWVSTDIKAARRALMLKVAAYTAMFLGAAGMAGTWYWSYLQNANLIAQTNEQTKNLVASAAPIIQEATVADRDLAKVEPVLNALRSLPAGFASAGEQPPFSSTWGLSQWSRLGASSEQIYKTGLERLMRSRLIYRMEELLEANRNRPEFMYEALKVYLILGGRQKLDKELITSWMTRDWADTLYPGAANAGLRESLGRHLQAMLDIEDSGSGAAITLNDSLIEEAQRSLARLTLAQRAYQIMRAQARPGQGRADWVASQRGGSDARTVFAAQGGDLDLIRVPYFYTYNGFHDAFLGRLREVTRQIEGERWVLGAAGEQAAVDGQYETLPQDLLKLYGDDFIRIWNETLARLRFQPLLSNRPQYPVLSAASAVTSPIRQILESVRDETRLTRERPAQPGLPQLPANTQNARAQASEAARMANIIAPGAISSLTQSRLDIALQAMERRAGPGAAPGENPGAQIEAAFRGFHNLFEGEQGRRPLDQVLLALSEINNNLRLLATNPATAPQVNATLPQQIQTLRNAANLMPPTFSSLIRNAADTIEQEHSGQSVSQLMQDLRSQVTSLCTQIVSNRYPFARNSDRDVPLAEFGRLFGPGGAMDQFFKTQLANFVDTSRPDWAFRQNIPVARQLPAAALRSFQQANEIREAFFPQGGNMPSFSMAITPLVQPNTQTNIRLEINGVAVAPQQGGVPTSVMWPGPQGLERTVLIQQAPAGFFGAQSPPVFGPERRGPWSFFRFLDLASVARRGDALVATWAFGGQSPSYQINISSLRNPLILPALRDFRCPGG